MLSWIVDKPSTELALNGTLLTEKSIKPLKHISNSCLDENIDLHRIQAYFTKGGWLALHKALKRMKKQGWQCGQCKNTLDSEQIACDSCLQWSHFTCVGVKKNPKAKKW